MSRSAVLNLPLQLVFPDQAYLGPLNMHRGEKSDLNLFTKPIKV
jgi:hypothetical protein